MLASSPFTSAQGAIDAATSPENASENLTTFWIQHGLCFTSGHVVHAIRSSRSNFVFSQSRIGRHLRDSFENGALPCFDDGLGNEVPVTRVARLTTNPNTRTPVGTEVFVYGPSQNECDSFEFELDIARAPQVADGLGGSVSPTAALLGATPGLAAGTLGASPIPPVQTNGTVASAQGLKPVPVLPSAVVHSDGRLCIPRLALEALAYETQTPIVGGEPVHVLMEDGVGLRIAVSPFTNSYPASPTTDRCRLHLTVPGVATVGQQYPIRLDGDTLLIAL